MIYLSYSDKKRMAERNDYEYNIDKDCIVRIGCTITSLYVIFEELSNSIIREDIVEVILCEKMQESLGFSMCGYRNGPNTDMLTYILSVTRRLDRVIDIIEYLVHVVHSFCKHFKNKEFISNESHDEINETIEKTCLEINEIFKAHCIGYELVLIDNRYTIKDVVNPIINKHEINPLLNLLPNTIFADSSTIQSANELFRCAILKYKGGEYRECIIDCRAAFESMLKIICSEMVKNGYEKYNIDGPGIFESNISSLIEAIKNGGLLDNYLNNSLDSLQKLLKTNETQDDKKNKKNKHIYNTVASTSNTSNKIVHPTTYKSDKDLASYVIGITSSTMLFMARRYMETISNIEDVK